MSNSNIKMNDLVSLCKRRGFIFPSCEIYGGFANTYTFGPYGTELKNNIKNLWWKKFVQSRSDMVGIDGAILLHPRVWEASGHTAGFNDALVDCKKCKARFRADTLIEEKTGKDVEGLATSELDKILIESDIKCPKCGNKDWTQVRKFNMMFKTHTGTVESDDSTAFLRPETAQAIFVTYNNILDTMRVKIPFGIAQIGKAFRNEITPGNFIFRLIEFEQMEIEYFIREKDWEKIFEEWQEEMWNWCIKTLQLNPNKLRIYEHLEEKLSHYSKRTIDIEYEYPFGFKELYGLAYRTDFDLTQHQKYSGKKQEYYDTINNERFIPHTIEPTFGVERSVLALLLDAYTEETAPTADGKEAIRKVMKFPKYLAPIKIAVLPLSKKPILIEPAMKIFNMLKSHWITEYDQTQSIGRRYRRQDEIGTLYCVTVDVESLEDRKVTVRDRDTMKQERISVDMLKSYVDERVN